MISGADIYNVLAAVVPLYVAMFLAYASVKWWKIFTPDQCSGINKFVAVFAIPLLSFKFISNNNPYAMHFKFIAADSLQKLAILILLSLWVWLGKNGSLDWMITLFSLSTLPNTIVVGIPLMTGMYGEFSAALMVQVVVMQSIVWYTLLLFLFEYRAGKILIMEQFPKTAGSIASLKVDPDVVSLSGREDIEADAEVEEDGRLHVTIRRSTSSRSRPSPYILQDYHGLSSMPNLFTTPRASSLRGMEIYSLESSRAHTPETSPFNNSEFVLQSPGQESNGFPGGVTRKLSADFQVRSSRQKRCKSVSNELHMFIWSAASPMFEGSHHRRVASHDFEAFKDKLEATQEPGDRIYTEEEREGGDSPEVTAEIEQKTVVSSQMPSVSVMTRLIFIMVWRKLVRNPNTYSSIIGLIWALVAFRWQIKMPKIIEGSISILSNAGLGMAMFSLGIFMALQPQLIACGKSAAALIMATRFLVGPIVMFATSIAIGLSGDLLRVAIVQAALPQGIVTFVFAREYGLHADILSTAVIFGMMIFLPVTIIYYFLLKL